MSFDVAIEEFNHVLKLTSNGAAIQQPEMYHLAMGLSFLATSLNERLTSISEDARDARITIDQLQKRLSVMETAMRDLKFERS